MSRQEDGDGGRGRSDTVCWSHKLAAVLLWMEQILQHPVEAWASQAGFVSLPSVVEDFLRVESFWDNAIGCRGGVVLNAGSLNHQLDVQV